MGRAPQRLAFASGVGTDADAQATYVSRGLLRRVVESQHAALASNAPVGPVDTEITIEREDLALSAVGCPLGHSGAGSDVLYVTLPPRYGTREWLSLVTLAARLYQQAESTWANRRLAENNAVVERELAQAAEIQSRLIPDVRQRDRIDVGIGFRACRWVAGDYLDVRQMADGRELLVVADVCGKGMQAALVARAVHTIVHVSGARPIRLVDLMDDLNNYLVQYLPPWSFVTAAAVALDPATGDLECVCAGHPAPLVVTADGRTVALQEGAHLPLGMGPIEWTPQRSTLPLGAWLALYTDGVTEMRQEDGAMLGTEAWERMLSAVIASTTPGTAAAQVALALEERLDAAQGRALSQDDRTYLVVRRRDGKHAN
jgi:serine phosphatase RsbU (regulator of sigma subunit)